MIRTHPFCVMGHDAQPCEAFAANQSRARPCIEFARSERIERRRECLAQLDAVDVSTVYHRR